MASRSKRPLYRKEALDTLASPEELDRLMQITRPGSWLLLAGFGGVLLMILVWGIFGRITTPLEQSGILTLSNPVAYIPAPAAGSVHAIDVQPGDVITTGMTLGSITTAEGTVAITSAVDGRVIAVRAGVGTPVDEGTPILSVAAAVEADQQQEVIVFVPLEDRQRIRAGMDAQILPATVERETYGYLEGDVISVAEFAATPEEMRAVLGADSLYNTSARSGPLFEVRVSLKTDANGATVWTASDGPDTPVVLGTPCLVRITIDSERPISKVFNLGWVTRR